MDRLVTKGLNGSQIEITCRGADLSGPVTSSSVFMIGSELLEVTAGRADFAEQTVQGLLDGVRFSEEYAFQGGRLRLGGKEVRVHEPEGVQVHRPRVAVWNDHRHSFYAHRHGGTTADLLRLMTRFQVTRSPEGLVVRPAAAAREVTASPAHPACVMLAVPDVGILEVVGLSAALENQLPRWQGTRTRGGELFLEARGEPRMHFVLVTPTARAQLVPFDVRRADRAITALEVMTVSWRGQD